MSTSKMFSKKIFKDFVGPVTVQISLLIAGVPHALAVGFYQSPCDKNHAQAQASRARLDDCLDAAEDLTSKNLPEEKSAPACPDENNAYFVQLKIYRRCLKNGLHKF